VSDAERAGCNCRAATPPASCSLRYRDTVTRFVREAEINNCDASEALRPHRAVHEVETRRTIDPRVSVRALPARDSSQNTAVANVTDRNDVADTLTAHILHATIPG